MNYQPQNELKASFDDVYGSHTPHAYLEEMRRLGYQIGEQASPFCRAAYEYLDERNGEAQPVQMLDVGCSYGLGSAFLKFGVSFQEMVSFFHSRAPEEPQACAAATRNWLNVCPPLDVRVVGLDASANAIGFALDCGLLDGGIARSFEVEGVGPNATERAWLRGCNLMISTGAIGYVTERTFDEIVPEIGQDHPGVAGSIAVFSILRMFEPEPIRASFERAGWVFAQVPGVRLPQRAFADDEEQARMIEQIESRGVSTAGLERDGVLYAELFAAAQSPEALPEVVERMQAVAAGLWTEAPLFAPHSEVAAAVWQARRE